MKGGALPPVVVLILCLVLVPLFASENAEAAVVHVSFSTARATPETYKSFISAVRAGIVSTAGGKSNFIPVLLSPEDPRSLLSYLNVTLVNRAGRSVSLKLDVTGAYFSGYEAGKYACYLKWSSHRAFSSATCFEIDPWSNAADMLMMMQQQDQQESGGGGAVSGGGDLAVGHPGPTWRLSDLDEAISSLFLYASGNATEKAVRRGLATIDMVIASAAMFPYVERRLSGGMWSGNGVEDDTSLHGLPSSWPDLSFAVQESFQGAFAAPVSIPLSGGKSLKVDSVRAAFPFLRFLQYDDRCERGRERMLIKPVVGGVGGGVMSGAASASCAPAEPTVHLSGPEARCVDVPYAWYYSGNQVQLWPCKDAEHQLWTLRRDGTIRSKQGKWCLSASKSSAGASVVITECAGCAASLAAWDVRVDGTVALRSCGLVLSAPRMAIGAALTVERDDRGTGQSWTPTNNTGPLEGASIVGYRDLCLQVESSGDVFVAACHGADTAWSLYPDGSVRPPAWLFLQWRCLAADASGKVSVRYCDGAGSACERWLFHNDGTIYNTGTGMVLDVKPSAGTSSRGKVVVSKAKTGCTTQKWALML